MKLCKNKFTIVEIALALSVLAIAIVSIMGILPVAMRAGKNSVADNSVSNVADFMKSYIDYKYNSESFSDFTTKVFPETEINFTPADYAGLADAPNIKAVKFYLNESGKKGAYKVELCSGANRENVDFSAAIKVWVVPITGNINIPINLTDISKNIFKGADKSKEELHPDDIDKIFACTVFMKISWPAEATETVQEDSKQQRIYMFDYFPKQ